MNLSDLAQVNQLAADLAALDARIAKAQTAQVFINGAQVPDDLMAQLLTAGLPIVQQYFASAREALVTQLSNLGVTA